jgi:hypothetical protein
MSDDAPAPESEEPGRDEQIHDLLEVPPLDDVTRRRLVRRAVEAAPGNPTAAPRSRFAFAVPVAAAIAVGLVIGAVVVTRPDDPTPTAAPAASSTPAPQGDGEQAGATDERALAPTESVAIADLGDLGTVESPDDLRTTAIVAQERVTAEDAVPGRVLPCTEAPADVGLTAIDAAGSATSDAAPVTVLLGRDSDGRTVAVAVTVGTCATVLRVTLSD